VSTDEAKARAARVPLIRTAVLTVGAVLAFLCGWCLLYSPSSDPKGIEFVLWKHGLYPMNLDRATGIMVGAPDGDKLVVGKTKAQLQEKFGYLLPLTEVSPYLRACYQSSYWNGRDVLFLRQSPWMVVFDGDKATDLVLIKGC
jgi:hypothetical protein